MNNKPPRRPVVGSRTPGQRPRRVAGQSSRPADAGTPPPLDEQPSIRPVDDTSSPVEVEQLVEEGALAEKQPAAVELPPVQISPGADAVGATADTPPADGVLSRQRTTVVLGSALAILLVVIAVLTWQVVDDDEPVSSEAWQFQGSDEPFDPPEHPMGVNYVEWRNASDAATNAVLDILTVDWKSYDEHLASVKQRMTDSFAEEYTTTAEDSRAKFLESKADYDFEVVGQSVISATATRVTSLLFLNQYVYKGTGDDRVGPDVYQVRVIVEAVPEGDEWLVDELKAL